MHRFALFAALLLALSAYSHAGEIAVTSSDRSGIGLVYTIDEFEGARLERNVREDVALFMDADQAETDRGSIVFPSESFLIAVPPNGGAILRRVDSDLLLNIFQTESTKDYRDAPTQPVVLSEPGTLRDQSVVTLTFYPAVYDPSKDHIVAYKQIEANIGFYGDYEGPLSVSHRESEIGEEIYKILLNYQEGKYWRKGTDDSSPKVISDGPFASGEWLKIHIEDDGIYAISGTDIQNAGVDISRIDPNTIKMFYGGGEQLPEGMFTPRRQNMDKIAIRVDDGGDGRLDPDDYMLFYGNNISRWRYVSRKKEFAYFLNEFTRQNVYWLTFGSGQGKRMIPLDGSLKDPDPVRPLSFRDRLHVEQELFSFEKDSGRRWYWEDYSGNRRVKRRLITSPAEGPTNVKVRFLGNQDNVKHEFSFSFNGSSLGNAQFYNRSTEIVELESPEPPRDGLNDLEIRQIGKTSVRLDWYELEYSRKFVIDEGELFFTSPVDSGSAQFEISGVLSPVFEILEVSDPFNVLRVVNFSYDSGKESVTFQGQSKKNPPMQYCIALDSQWKSPARISLKENSNLRSPDNGADYLLITHRDFIDEARRLAEWRETDDRFGPPLSVELIDVEHIYDEFSWGVFDPTAIRDFIKHTFGNWRIRPTFVNLFGDGSFDYKNNSGISPGNWIPPYEKSISSLDEWYVLVSDDRDRRPDMAIGRISVQTKEEAKIVSDKIIGYDRDPEIGDWQSKIIIVADDERKSNPASLEPDFAQDAEDISLNFVPQELDQVKIFLMEFDKIGRFKPDANRVFIDAFNKGAVLLSYVGHGNSDVLAHEHVFVASSDMSKINNGRRLPLMYLAASQTGWFDDPDFESLPETMVKWPVGGCIAVIGATRVGFHASNMDLNRRFYDRLFLSKRESVPIGLAFWEAKLLVGSGGIFNTRRYTIFGDPGTRLSLPLLSVDIAISKNIKALEEVKFEGSVLSPDGDPTDFQGQAIIKVFDSGIQVIRTIESPRDVRYFLPGATIFKGTFPVDNGHFAGAFKVPKDVTYGGRFARISAFVWNDRISGTGEVESISITGTAEASVQDETGPTIEIGFQGQKGFQDGDFVSRTPILEATIQDENGINVTGEIGHEIQIKIDDERVFKVTENFVNQDSYQVGVLKYQLPQLSEGEHTIVVKAWDTFNNSSKKVVQVVVASEREFSISNLLCYPNPMTSQTTFTYELSQPALSVKIKVFSPSGRLIDDLEGETGRGYNQTGWIPDVELANGVYLYKIEVLGSGGDKDEKTDKIVVMR